MMKQQGFAYTPVIIMLVTIGAVSYMWYAVTQYRAVTDNGISDFSRPAVQHVKKTTTNANSDTNSSSVTNQSADWKTYTNVLGGYTLQYPPTWEKASTAAANTIAGFYDPNNQEFVNVVPEVGTVDLRDYASFTKLITEVSLGDHVAAKVVWSDNAGNKQACWYQFANPPAEHWDTPNAAGDKGNKIHFSCSETETVKHILSTFAFTK